MKKITVLELLIVLAILFLESKLLKAQTCTDTTPKPVVIRLIGRDSISGAVLYSRNAYVFFGPINEYGEAMRLEAQDEITITRVMRQSGERCNDALPEIIESAEIEIDNCHFGTRSK